MSTPSFHHFFIILFCFLCTMSKGRTLIDTTTQSKPKVPALYVFGDSIVENGNNNNFFTIAKGNYYPYGIDFPKGATGRFCNGKTDYHILHPMLVQQFGEKIGFNYASSACGILPESGMFLGKCLNLDKQIRYFHDTIEWRLKKYYTNPEELSEHLSKSILLFVIGNNDYLNNYMNKAYINTYKKMNPEEFSEFLVNYLARQLKKLYTLGVRKIIFSEIAPVGCMPYMSNRTSINQETCNETKNEIVSVFNQGVQKLFSNLSSILPDSKFVVSQNFKLVHEIVNNPTQYGFDNSRHSCCEATKKELKCVRGIPPCKDRKKYCFWDGFHTTEAMNNYVISRSLSDNPIDFMLE
ncbi:LOW QUALITY PROTEIN: hypothetical protein V2J09_013341 [Rumex salicifolius]